MSLVYILMEDGTQATHEEARVRELLAKQALSPDVRFWKEGMKEWRPLAELPSREGAPIVPPRREENPRRGASAQSVPIPVLSTGDREADLPEGAVYKRKRFGRYYFRSNPIPLTVCLQILLVVSFVGATCFIYQFLDLIYGWSHGTDAVGWSAPFWGADAQQVSNSGISSVEVTSLLRFYWPMLYIHVLIEMLFIVWVYMANRNCRGFANNMIYTSLSAVASFFIPVVNLFRPYLVMQEIWRVCIDPPRWMGLRDSIFIGFWFAIHLSAVLLLRGFFDDSYSLSDDANVRAMGRLVYFTEVEVVVVLIEVTTLILVSVVVGRQMWWVRKGRQK